MERLLALLDKAGIGADGWRDRVAEHLGDHVAVTEAVARRRAGRSSTERLEQADAGHEKPTHVKWPLHTAPDGWRIWLHQYKDGLTAAVGYSQLPHNHRYDFVSVVLGGGFVSDRYALEPLRVVDSQSCGPGSVLSLDHRVVHALRDVRPGTVTFVVQGPALRNHSESFDPVTGRAVRRPDLIAYDAALDDTLDAALRSVPVHDR